jgi:hypothetical protein
MVYPEFDASVMVKEIDDLYESLLISNCSRENNSKRLKP